MAINIPSLSAIRQLRPDDSLENFFGIRLPRCRTGCHVISQSCGIFQYWASAETVMLRLLVFLCAILVFDASAASFDCTRAKTNIERLICSDKTLSALDDKLDGEYENAKQLLSVKEESLLNAQQKAWLIGRNKCNDRSCLKQCYEVRIRELACAQKNMGSAIGAGNCYYLQLRESENMLAPLEQQYARQVIATSNNPENAKEVLATESKKWREYRDAQCALFGETEGGSDGWKNAWATACALEETNKRVAELTHQRETK